MKEKDLPDNLGTSLDSFTAEEIEAQKGCDS